MSWGNDAPLTASLNVIPGTTLVELYKDNGDNIFTWGGEGSLLQSSAMGDVGGGLIFFGASWDYGVDQGVQNFWVVYHDPTGDGFYSVPSGGVHSVANDAMGTAIDNYNVPAPSTWNAIVAVPEPSTVGLLLVGAGLVAPRRFRKA